MHLPIIVFHPVFAKYLFLARGCCPDSKTLNFTKELVETAKWYFKCEVHDYTPVMKKMFGEYLEAAGLSSVGEGNL